MQQQICQPDQMGQPQQQQVMLCPVRLVYETQILVQPGEQIQPNQTLFINPQNPPPWIQNQARQPSQVIYMQQMPSNMVTSVPQHMDQNQMYLQNLQGYYPQQMIQMDPRQMQNVVQMMPNINNIGQITGQNINNLGQNVVGQVVGQNVSNINHNVMNTTQNVMPITNIVQNVQKPANVGVNIAQNVGSERVYNNTNLMPNTIPMANQNTMTNTQIQDRTVNMNQNLVNMQKVAEMQGMRPQSVRQPQVTVSPMQNVKYAHNTVDIKPIAPPHVEGRPVNSPRPMTMSNIPNNVIQANALNKKVLVHNKPNPNVMTNQVRHHNQTYYRHIQPKPMNVTPIQNQYIPMGTQTMNVPRPTQMVNDVTRKRKSESPDETRKKIPNIANHTITSISTASQQMPSNMKTISVVQPDTGVSTTISYIPTPVRDFKLTRNVETASTGTQANIAKEKPQVMEMKIIPPVSKDCVQIESDKLVRNTVFTQARGLLRTEPQTMQPDVIIRIEKVNSPTKVKPNDVMNMETSETSIGIEPAKIEPPKTFTELVKETNPSIELLKIDTLKPSLEPVTIEESQPRSIPHILSTELLGLQKPSAERVKIDIPLTAPEQVKIKKPVPRTETLKTETIKITENKTLNSKTEPIKIETVTKAEVKPKEIKKEVQVKKEEKQKIIPNTEIKTEKPSVAKPETLDTKPVKKEAKEVKEPNRKFTVTSINDFKGNELQIADGSVKKEDTDHFILTHVLDGYVIQESNTAFPIRKPLKEKIIYQNADHAIEQKKEETYKHRTEDGKLIKDNSKILSISDLNLNEDELKTEQTTISEEPTNVEEKEDKCDEVSDAPELTDQPFLNLTPSTIKSWTVDQLASHLSKFNWAETISVLSEHEIDGESLFLVSKPQLVQIGVSETHAEVICDFIKNS